MIKKILTFYFMLVLMIAPGAALAQSGYGTGNAPGYTTGSAPGYTTGNSPSGLMNPLAARDVCAALKLFLNALLTLAVPVAVLFLVYSGFLFVWARGSKDGLIKAKNNFFYTVLGIALFMGAWTLGQVIANTLSSLGGQAGQQTSLIGQCR